MWWTELREVPVSGTCGMDLSLQTNLPYYLIGGSVPKSSIGGFILNLKPLLGASVSGSY